MFNNPKGSSDTPTWWLCDKCIDRYFSPTRTKQSLHLDKEVFGIVSRVGKQQTVSEFFDAIIESDTERVKVLLTENQGLINARKDTSTPLHIAAWTEHDQIITLLLAAGADPNATDNMGATALHCAAMKKNMAICEMLLKHGADPNAKDAKGNDPMSMAMSGVNGIYLYQNVRAQGLKPTNVMQLLEYYGWGKKPWWKFW
jgi:ankyrin repeat protein